MHQRLALPQVTIAALFSVRPETIGKRIRDIRQLLAQAGHTIQPGPHQPRFHFGLRPSMSPLAARITPAIRRGAV